MDRLLWWDHTYEEIKEMPKDTIIVQPIAAVEQHGPHLPVGTDCKICMAFANHLMERFKEVDFPALFLPLLPYGKSNEHLMFPGTVTYTAETLMRVLHEVGASVKRAGFKKLVLLNGHGGNHEVLDLMSREIRIATGLQVYCIHPLLKIMPENMEEFGLSLNEREAWLGIHAGRVETSLIMYVDEDLVRKDKMAPDYPELFDGKNYLDFSERIPYGWMTQDVSKTGAIGDPTGSTADEGGRWIKATGISLMKAFEDIRQVPEDLL